MTSADLLGADRPTVGPDDLGLEHRARRRRRTARPRTPARAPAGTSVSTSRTGPSCCDPSVVEPHRPLADPLDRGQVVGDEHEGRPLQHHRPHPVDAPLLERGVAHGEHLVDEQHVGLEERGHAEAEPHLHPARIELHLPVDGVVELGEARRSRRTVRRHVLAGQTEQRAVEVDVLAPGELRVDARPHLDERADPAADLDPAGVGVHHPGQDLEQRRLARAVDADQADRLARLRRPSSTSSSAQRQPRRPLPCRRRLTCLARARIDARVGSARNRFQMSVAAIVPSGDVGKAGLHPLEQQVADDSRAIAETPRRWRAGPAGAARRAAPCAGTRR